jgi:hypothetical protein
MKFKSIVLAIIFSCLMWGTALADNQDVMWLGFEVFSFDRPQYFYNVNGHDYTQAEVDSMVKDFQEAGFSGVMLELEWEYNKHFTGLGRGWYGPTNGDSIINQYFKDEKVTQYFIASAKNYGLKISIIVSSLNDRIGTNDDGFTDPYNSTYPWWIYPNEKAFDLFKRKVDIIASLGVDDIVIDFASTPHKLTDYNDTAYAVLDLTDNQIDYIKTNYPEIEVYVAVNPTYRDGVALDGERVKMHGGKLLHWENHDYRFILGVESSDEGYFIYPVHPSFWWNVGITCPIDLAQELVYNTDASPAIVFLHTPLTHDDYVSYAIQGVIGPGLANQYPVLQPLDDITVKEVDAVNIVVNVVDPDDDILTLWISDPRFSLNGNVFTWQTQEGDRGIYDLTIIVTDPYYCSDTQDVTVTVNSLKPYNFYLISPDGDTLPNEITFSWQESVGPDSLDNVFYCLSYGTSSTFHPDSTTEVSGLINTSYTLTDVDLYTTHYWKVKAYTQDGVEVFSDQACNFLAYQSMDVNCDNNIGIQDVVYLVNFLYNDGVSPCIPQVADNNCSKNPSISDVICMIMYLFRDGPVNCCPQF